MQPSTDKRRKDRFERFNIVFAVLLAGWVPSILMLVVSYTVLRNTLESNILRDRQSFVNLIAHLIDDDFARTGNIIEFYQTAPEMERVFAEPALETSAQQWLNLRYYTHPRIDGMFLAGADGKLLGALPPEPALLGKDYNSALWKASADAATGASTSPVFARSVDKRMATQVVSALRGHDGKVIGYLGASVLVERVGRRLSTITFADQAVCQIIDQSGTPLFGPHFRPRTDPISDADRGVVNEILRTRSGHFTRDKTIYSFSPLQMTGWIALVQQPREDAYAPVHNLLSKMSVLAGWLIAGTAIAAWLAGQFYRRQIDAARRIEREVTFNEKILANMPTGIALVDPTSRRFLHVNDAFAQMARQFGNLPNGVDINNATYDQVKIAPQSAIEPVLSVGSPFQLVEQPFEDRSGNTRFVNVNLLRLQDSQQTVQGVLYLVDDKTRDMTLRHELIDANAAKDQFLALLSHELRNPLSPVIAMVSELEATAPETPQIRHALEIIRRNVELEARLIDDLLDVTRIAKGKLQLTSEPVSVHEVLERAYEICREEAVAKKLRIDFDLQAERDYVDGDPARLQQIFWNLVKNSVKFTPSGGRITIASRNLGPDKIEVRTSDTGIGIETEKIERIFNAFEQGQSSITRQFGGLGLGLAISKAMVEAHGGTIAVESAGKGQGATFTVTLHAIATPAKSAPSNGLKLRATSAPTSPRAKPAHVLVVDDHQDTCIGLKLMLERRGYEITTANSANQAIEEAQAADFDLLISDIGLPDRSGYELMTELRDSKGIRGIALSGFGMENDVARAHEAGFSEHLTKPINFERLHEAIEALLAEKSAPIA